ncbi:MULTISPECIES: dihydrofolate reductase family protein [Dietzia]|uniref:dihydrofolate reductase family protein n=1 Tax=Dietzia TaxID=37914 RepID=UPI0015FD0CDA|nr:dihydrofolate reductase family protein [Dietzia cinnamea]MBB1021277.1 dihydrofolate reductase family protein [Dietzia sp. E1]MCT1639593.1 dihydrofolate reductase family protein [Dietzia cinnamea]
MSQLIYTAFVSLDGVVEAPGGEPGYRNTGWTFAVEFLEEVYGLKAREQDEAGSMLLGRVSYQAFSAVWPQMVDEFPKYNAIPKYVVSTTLAEGDLVDGWGTTTILRDLDEVAALKQAEGAPILVQGSATLARSLSDAGLIDRYHLLVFPWILGAGKRMWSDTDKPRQKLELVESEAYGNGVQKLIYDVVGFDPEV